MTTSKPTDNAGRKTIIELGAKWAAMLKISIVVITVCGPVLSAWACWVTSETFVNREFRHRGDRFTREDAAVMRLELTQHCEKDVAEIHREMAAQPSQDWRDKIGRLENSVDNLVQNVARNSVYLETLVKRGGGP